MQTNYEPRLVVFVCNWSGTGGTGAGLPGVKVVKVKCSGKVEPGAVLKAFFEGADGVLIAACGRDECRYAQGSEQTVRHFETARRMLDLLGVARTRLRLESVAGDTDLEALAAGFADEVRSLGPNVMKVSETDRQVVDRMVQWMEALDAVANSVTEEKEPPSKGVVFSQAFRISVPRREQIPEAESWITADPKLCAGCRICEAVCSQSHEGIINPELARIRVAYDAFRKYPQIYCKPDICRQCTGADCVAACPFGALQVDPDTGARFIDYNLCTGCRSCQEACQWGMITYVPEKNICIKCDLCGGDPECVKACPAGALKYVNTKGGFQHVRVAR